MIVNNHSHLFIFIFTLLIPFSVKSQTGPSKDKIIQAANEIITSSTTCALITTDTNGTPRVRTMDPFMPEDDFTIWFGTNPNSRKVAQIKNDPGVTLYYEDEGDNGYVTIRGKAELVDDLKMKEKYFKKEWEAFYPNKDEDYLLIRVSPDWMEVVNVEKGIVGDQVTWTPPLVKFSQNIPRIDSKPFTVGETISFYSEILEEERILNVYLPLNYQPDSAKTYPVLYLLDGSVDEDIIHIAGLVQFCSFPWIKIIPESIVIGVGNVDRKRDFTFPTGNAKDKKDFPTTGGSEKFIEFIASELQPLVEENFKTNNQKTIIGQSLGGLLATEILLYEPGLFDNYIIVSPSLWWDDESLLQLDPSHYKTEKPVYIGVGKEGPVMERVAQQLFEKIKSASPGNEVLFYQFFEKQNHGDALHLAVYDAFEKLFK